MNTTFKQTNQQSYSSHQQSTPLHQIHHTPTHTPTKIPLIHPQHSQTKMHNVQTKKNTTPQHHTHHNKQIYKSLQHLTYQKLNNIYPYNQTTSSPTHSIPTNIKNTNTYTFTHYTIQTEQK